MYIVYSKPACSHCDQAKAVLRARGLDYKEIVLDVGQQKVDGTVYMPVQEFKAANPLAKSVPQIFHNGSHIGGFTELRIHLES